HPAPRCRAPESAGTSGRGPHGRAARPRGGCRAARRHPAHRGLGPPQERRLIHLPLLRHGATTWTASRRLPGRRDIPLSPAARTAWAGWQLPEAVLSWSWQTSPLARCRETADLLRCHHAGAPAAIVEPRLIEMSFGQWEGQRLAALRAADPDGVAAREARGLD